jgi:hypothetical protein
MQTTFYYVRSKPVISDKVWYKMKCKQKLCEKNNSLNKNEIGMFAMKVVDSKDAKLKSSLEDEGPA